MRTTVVIPDKLFREAKAKAALEGRKFKDLIIEGLQFVVMNPQPSPSKRSLRKAKFPLVSRPGKGHVVTDAMVNAAIEETFAEEAETHARAVRR
jgi:hypothetical protein